MNGASTELCANTKSAPTNSITTMIGSSHHFFRTRMKAQSSRARLPLLMMETPGSICHEIGLQEGGSERRVPQLAVGSEVGRWARRGARAEDRLDRCMRAASA